MTLVNSEDVSNYLNGVAFSPRQLLHIEQVVIPGVQRELETYLNRPIEPMHVREGRQPDCEGKVFVTVSPVWKVLSIDYGPISATSPALADQYAPPLPLTPVLETAREWDPAGTWMQDPAWMIQQGSPYIFVPGWTWDPSMPMTGGYVVVEYIGGYNGYVDEGLKLANLRVIAREVEKLYDNSAGLRDGGGVPVAPSDARNKGWTVEELAQWDRLRRRVVVG